MIGPRLTASQIDLVAPKIRRDAPLSVAWLNGPVGHETMRLMGNLSAGILDTDLAAEEARIQTFLDDQKVYHWMIKTGGRAVGAIWLNRTADEHLEAPSVHFMIGDPAARGHGIASKAVNLVINWAHENVSDLVYSRALVENGASRHLLEKQGGVAVGAEYSDEDGLVWQNYCVSVKRRR